MKIKQKQKMLKLKSFKKYNPRKRFMLQLQRKMSMIRKSNEKTHKKIVKGLTFDCD